MSLFCILCYRILARHFYKAGYYDILAECVNFCRKEKGMELYYYCFMPSHCHFIFRSSNEKPMELLRDFKKYTSKKILEAIETNSQEIRKEWLLWMFKRAGKNKGNINTYQFWQHYNKHPLSYGV